MRTAKRVLAALAAVLASGCAGSGDGNREDFDAFACLLGGIFPCLFEVAEPRPAWSSIRGSGTQKRVGYDSAGSGLIQPSAADPSTFELSFAEAANRADGTFWYLQAGSFRFDGAGVHLPGQPGLAVVTAAPSGWAAGNVTPFVDPAAERYSLVAPNRHVGVAGDPRQLGWSYQSFGIWNTVSSEGGAMSVATFGNVTPATAVPASGSATFSGKLAGFYITPGGEGSIASAGVTVAANFGARSLALTSSGTTTTRDLSTAVAAPALNLHGLLTYQPGSASFAGTLSNAGGTMSGQSGGMFYGPAAQELGGTFTLRSGTSAESFVGAYGAKR